MDWKNLFSKHWKMIVLLPYLVPILMVVSVNSAGSLVGGLLTLLVAGYIFAGYSVLLVLSLILRWVILRRRK